MKKQLASPDQNMLGSLSIFRRPQAVSSLSCSLLPFYFSCGKPPFLAAEVHWRFSTPASRDLMILYCQVKESCLDTKGCCIVSCEHRGTDTRCILLQTFQIWFVLQIICWWSVVIIFLLGWLFGLFLFCFVFSECLFQKWCSKPFKKIR